MLLPLLLALSITHPALPHPAEARSQLHCLHCSLKLLCIGMCDSCGCFSGQSASGDAATAARCQTATTACLLPSPEGRESTHWHALRPFKCHLSIYRG